MKKLLFFMVLIVSIPVLIINFFYSFKITKLISGSINNPKKVIQYGGVVSAPIAKSILTDAISILDIKKRNTTTEKKYNWDDKKYYTVTNVVGKTPKEASKELSKYNVEYSGNGNVVISQSPDANTRLKEGSTVRLMLGN